MMKRFLIVLLLALTLQPLQLDAHNGYKWHVTQKQRRVQRHKRALIKNKMHGVVGKQDIQAHPDVPMTEQAGPIARGKKISTSTRVEWKKALAFLILVLSAQCIDAPYSSYDPEIEARSKALWPGIAERMGLDTSLVRFEAGRSEGSAYANCAAQKIVVGINYAALSDDALALVIGHEAAHIKYDTDTPISYRLCSSSPPPSLTLRGGKKGLDNEQQIITEFVAPYYSVTRFFKNYIDFMKHLPVEVVYVKVMITKGWRELSAVH